MVSICDVKKYSSPVLVAGWDHRGKSSPLCINGPVFNTLCNVGLFILCICVNKWDLSGAVGFADLCAVHSWSLEDNTQVPAPAGEAEREQDSWVGRLQGLGRKG